MESSLVTLQKPYKVTKINKQINIYISDTEGLLQQNMKHLLVLRMLYQMIHPNEYNSRTSQDVMLVLLVSLRNYPLTTDCSWFSSVLQEL